MNLDRRNVEQYFLRRWGGYERNREYLTPQEHEDAFVFFQALKQLSEPAFELLASKYHTGIAAGLSSYDGLYHSEVPNTDADEAEKRNLSIGGYRTARIVAERELRRHLKVAAIQAETTINRNMDEFQLKLGDLYVQDVEDFYDTRMILTSNQKAARVFDKASGTRLADKYHLKRVVPK